MHDPIHVETKIAIAALRLATGDYMQLVANKYRVEFLSNRKIVAEFISATKQILLPTFIKCPLNSMMQKYVAKFKSLHNILYVVGAIDELHIPIIAPTLHVANYYNKNNFYSGLL